jgi:GxxExxY protein
MGILFKVHNKLGPSLLEKHYQRAVAKELGSQKIPYKREISIYLQYEGENIGKYFLDFTIDEKIILELKAEKYNNPIFFKQVLSYLKQTHLPLAILANFRREKLEYRRIINAEYKDQPFE